MRLIEFKAVLFGHVKIAPCPTSSETNKSGDNIGKEIFIPASKYGAIVLLHYIH